MYRKLNIFLDVLLIVIGVVFFIKDTGPFEISLDILWVVLGVIYLSIDINRPL
jgi:hypothetical protein